MAEVTTRTEVLPDVLSPGRLFIDGEWVDAASGGTITVMNPARQSTETQSSRRPLARRSSQPASNRPGSE